MILSGYIAPTLIDTFDTLILQLKSNMIGGISNIKSFHVDHSQIKALQWRSSQW